LFLKKIERIIEQRSKVAQFAKDTVEIIRLISLLSAFDPVAHHIDREFCPRLDISFAVEPGTKVWFDPGIPRKVVLLPFGGNRVIRGHAGLADGPLDAEGAMESALELARERGYRGA